MSKKSITKLADAFRTTLANLNDIAARAVAPAYESLNKQQLAGRFYRDI
jgi:hypothetical protein